jgi:hypothetical protein
MSIASFCSTPAGLLEGTSAHCLLKSNDIMFTKYKRTKETGTKSAADTPAETSVCVTKPSLTEPFSPKRFDTLFWCMYAALKGTNAYHDSGRHEFAVEKSEKFSYMDTIQSSGDEMKTALKARSIRHQHVMDVLMNRQRIDILTCIAIAMICGKSLWIELKHVFVRHIDASGGRAIVIRRNDTSSSSYELVGDDWTDAELSKYIEGLECGKLEIMDLEKPMKGISAYSANDLQDMAKKVAVELVDMVGKRKLKKTLYTEISARISLPKN